MPSKELTTAVILAITNAERKGINLPPLDHIDQMLLNDADYIRPQAEAAISTILAAIQEPNANQEQSGMREIMGGTGYVNHEIYIDPETPWHTWSAMLNASPLGEKAE